MNPTETKTAIDSTAPGRAGNKMKRIVVSLLKGGVAKSETAVSLAYGLSAKGRRVLLVDTDVQAHCSDMLGVSPEQGLADLVAGWGPPESVLTEARENLWLLAGGNDLAALKMEIARREMASEAVLNEAFEVFEGRFDYLIMDTAPGWDTLLVNALYASQDVLSPVSMEPMALSGLIRFEERLQVIQRYKPDLRLRWVVPTFVDGRVKKTNEILLQLQQRYGDLVGPLIRYSVKASEAPAFGKTLFEHDPRGTATKGYQRLTDLIIQDCEGGEEVPPQGLGERNPEPIPSVLERPAPPEPEPRPTPFTPTLVGAGETRPGPTPAKQDPAPASEQVRESRVVQLTRRALIDKILKLKESSSPRSSAKFTWIIERLSSSDRRWTEEDLKLLNQLIERMVKSGLATEDQARPGPAPGTDPETGTQAPQTSGPLTARLKQNSPPESLSPESVRIG